MSIRSFIKSALHAAQYNEHAPVGPTSTVEPTKDPIGSVFNAEDLLTIASAAQEYVRASQQYDKHSSVNTKFYSARSKAEEKLADVLASLKLDLDTNNELANDEPVESCGDDSYEDASDSDDSITTAANPVAVLHLAKNTLIETRKFVALFKGATTDIDTTIEAIDSLLDGSDETITIDRNAVRAELDKRDLDGVK